MIENRLLLHAILLTLSPIVVAWLGMSVPAAVVLVLLLLLLRWVIVLSGFVAPEKKPDVILATISASHFVEKVRWNMDRLGLDYTEQVSGGALGAFFTGRTVPQLKFRTGGVRSSIGNSTEILRYLWGRYAADNPEAAAFLEPTTERAEFEQRLDKYGVSLQVWVYYHILRDRDLTLHAWGANSPVTPLWQRQALRLLFPVLRFLIQKSFRITDDNYARSLSRIEALLGEVDAWLEDGRASLLGGNELNYTDFAFAAMTGLWLMPVGYGGGKADAVRIERDRAPAAMQKDVESWGASYSRVVAFVERLYRDERQTTAAGAGT